jgi:F0F1-type ATP synthase assembly protein I
LQKRVKTLVEAMNSRYNAREMPDSKKQDDGEKTPPPSKKMVILVFSTVGDTTWRLFIPTIGGTLLGLWADKSWGTTPWLMILGIVLGSAAAVALVRAQLKKVNNT